MSVFLFVLADVIYAVNGPGIGIIEGFTIDMVNGNILETWAPERQVTFVGFTLFSRVLTWAWLAKPQGHSSHTKILPPSASPPPPPSGQIVYGKNE